jgi:hypothetical protein
MMKKKFMSEAWRRREFQVAAALISSRLLMLQSTRLALKSAERRLRRSYSEALRVRVEELRLDIATAQHNYRKTVLEWGSPEDEDFWVVAYSGLIQKGQLLNGRLRAAIVALPVTERYEVAADIEVLEGIVEGWTESMRRAMANSVA